MYQKEGNNLILQKQFRQNKLWYIYATLKYTLKYFSVWKM